MKLTNILSFFNSNGEDNIRKLVIDNDVINSLSGTWNLDDKRKLWAGSLSDESPGFLEKQFEVLWQPQEIDLTKDILVYEQLDNDLKESIDNILSFLQYLDSVVPENDINLMFITGDYEIKQALLLHSYIEGGIHTKSYQYILKSLKKENSKEIKKAYYKFKENKHLAERNKIIAKNFQGLRNLLYNGILNTDIEKYKIEFFRSIVQDFIIESTVFYMGFMFFHLLADKLPGINQEILLIKRDEELHVNLFNKIIKTFAEEEKMFYDESIIYEILEETVNADIEFYSNTIGDKLPGLTENNISTYIKQLADKRLATLGLKPLFNVKDNPFRAIEALNNKSELRKASFFETGSVEYFTLSDIDWEGKVIEELKKINGEV